LALASAINSRTVFGETTGGQRGSRDVTDEHHRHEVAVHVVWHLVVHELIGDETARCEQQRVAVGRRLRRKLESDQPAAAGLVDDDSARTPRR
jgi:hypothetical protein